MAAEWILLAISSGLSIAALGQWRTTQREFDHAQRTVRRAAVRVAELVRFAVSHQRMGEIQQLAESSIDGTTALVRAIHRGIAGIPFGILEQIPATRDTTRLVREIHDLTSDGIYSGIAVLNRKIGERARSQIRSPATLANTEGEDAET